MLSLVLWTLVGGAVIGFLGKLLAPGDQRDVPLWLTILCGSAGILIGNWLYTGPLEGAANTPGMDWLRHVVQVVVAAALVLVAAVVMSRRARLRD